MFVFLRATAYIL